MYEQLYVHCIEQTLLNEREGNFNQHRKSASAVLYQHHKQLSKLNFPLRQLVAELEMKKSNCQVLI